MSPIDKTGIGFVSQSDNGTLENTVVPQVPLKSSPNPKILTPNVSTNPQNRVYNPHASMHRINPYTTATVSDASPILKETPPGQGSQMEILVKSKGLENLAKFTNPLVEDQILASSKSRPLPSSIPSEVDREASEKDWSNWYYRVKKPSVRQNVPPVGLPEVKSSAQVKLAKNLLNYMLKIRQLLPEGNLLEPCGIHNRQVKMELPTKLKSNNFKVPVASRLIYCRHTHVLIVNKNFPLNTMLTEEIQLGSLPLSLIQVPNRYRRNNC